MPFFGRFRRLPLAPEQGNEREDGQNLQEEQPPIVGKVFPLKLQAFDNTLFHGPPQGLVELFIEFHTEERRGVFYKSLTAHLLECGIHGNAQLTDFLKQFGEPLLQGEERHRGAGRSAHHGIGGFLNLPEVFEGNLRLGLPQRFLPFFPEKVFVVPFLPKEFEFRQFRGNRIKERSDLALLVLNELLNIEQPVNIPGSRIPHPRDPFAELAHPVLSLTDLLAVG